MKESTYARFTSGPARAIVAALALGLLVSACSDASDSSSGTTAAPTTTVADAACADSEALRASVAALEEVDVAAEGTDGLTAAVETVKTDLEAFGASASAELQPLVEAVQTGITELEAAITAFDADGAAPVLAAVSAVTSSAATLVDTLDTGCGS